MLLEEGFEVVSADASDKMLKTALNIRWERRKEDIFDNWGMMVSYLSVLFVWLYNLKLIFLASSHH